MPARASTHWPRGRRRQIAGLAAAAALALGGCRHERRPAPHDAAPPAAPRWLARIDAADGDVRVQHASGGRWQRITSGQALAAGDTVQSMPGGHAVIRIAASGATMTLGPGTTVRIGGDDQPAHAERGSLIARLDASPTPRRLAVALPPGTLLLATDPRAQPVAEAEVRLTDGAASVAMRVGTGRIERQRAAPIDLGHHAWIDLDAGGSVVGRGEDGPVPTVTAPDDGARLRVRNRVALTWTPVAEADQYLVVLRSSGVERRLIATAPHLDVAVTTGHYQWTVAALRQGVAWPASPARAVDVESDDRPPPLEITSPAPGAAVAGPTLRLTGVTEPQATIEAAGHRATADRGGRFTLAVPLQRGVTNLVVSASDDLGNTRRVTRSVLWD